MSCPRLHPLFVALGLALARLAYADSSADGPSTLEPVTVAASRNLSTVEDMPLHTTVLMQQDIQKSSAQSLDQLLRTVAGFNFTGAPSYISDPTGNQTKVRGLGNDKVLVLMDGVPIHDPFYLTTQWNRVFLANVERIEIVRGGATSSWGSMAVGGVVNVITRTARDDSGEVDFNAGNFATANLTVSKNFLLSTAWSLNLSANEFRTDGYQPTPTFGLWRYPDKTSPHDANTGYQATAFYHPDPDLQAFLRLGVYIQNQNLYGTYGANQQYSPDFSAGLTDRIDRGSNVDVHLWAQYVNFEKTNGASCWWTGKSCLTSSSNYTPAQATAAQAGAYQALDYFSQFGNQNYREQGAASVYTQQLSGLLNSIQFGADYRKLSVEDSETYYNTPSALTRPQNLNGQSTGTGEQTFTGAFLQARLVPMPALEITLNARYDSWENTDRKYSLNTAAHGLSPGSGDAPNYSKNQFDPSLAMHLALDDSWSVRGAAFRAFRAPGLNNQTRSYGSTVANPNLIPETVTGWEIGGDYRSDTFTAGATLFVNNIQNMIATYSVSPGSAEPVPVINLCSTAASLPNTLNCGGTTVSFYSNDQAGRSAGLELTSRWQLRPDLRVDGFFTVTNTILTSRSNGVTTPLDTQLVGIPRDTASLGVTWSPSERLRLFTQAYYLGPQSVYQTSTTNVMQGSNTTVNASVNYALSARTDLFANVVNLLDRKYQDGSYTATQPWSQTLSPPLTATVGVRHRF